LLGFWDLLSFWGSQAKATAIIQSLRLRLRSGLRQSGSRFAAASYGTRERVPFQNGGAFYGMCERVPLQNSGGFLRHV